MQNSEGRSWEESQKSLWAWLERLTLLPPTWSFTVLMQELELWAQGMTSAEPSL